MIHSSSATIGIVMGLGAAGILDWQTAVAFSLGADLGTTVTSWLASLNLSKNAKRAAYAHIAFNFIGVAVMFPLFFVSMDILQGTMGLFGMDVTRTSTVDGKESFPMVPVAVGLYSIGFNIFNTALMFPFIGVRARALAHRRQPQRRGGLCRTASSRPCRAGQRQHRRGRRQPGTDPLQPGHGPAAGRSARPIPGAEERRGT